MAFQVSFKEDSSASVLGRITARNGTGAATGVDGEGNFLKQADITSITYAIFDLEAPTTSISTGTLTVSSVVFDTVQGTSSNAVWDVDDIGYNFLHDLAYTNFPNGDVIIRIEYTITLTGGAVLTGAYEGTVCDKKGS